MTDMTALLTSVIETPRFSRLPVGLRRRAIRCLWHAQCLTGGSPDFGLGALFEDVLRVSGRAARQLQREVAFHDLMAASGWRALDRFGRGGFERDLASIAIPEAGTLARLAEAPRPIILAPLHMGAFALPLARMMRDHFGDRRLLILRAGAARGPETGAMQRIGELGIDWRTLDITDKQAYPDAVRFASGRAVIVSFCDLPGRFGSPQPVTLFGRRCALAAGLAALVRLTNAVAVPIAVHSTLGGDQVTLGPTFESHGGGTGERARIAALLAAHIETSVLAAPGQWHMWPRFHEYLAPAEGEQPPVDKDRTPAHRTFLNRSDADAQTRH